MFSDDNIDSQSHLTDWINLHVALLDVLYSRRDVVCDLFPYGDAELSLQLGRVVDLECRLCIEERN